jgi:hypothetical protein
MVVSACLLVVEIAEIVSDLGGIVALVLATIKFILSCWDRLTRKADRTTNSPLPAVPSDWLLTCAA